MAEKVAIVTGGGSGIGRAVALQLAESGYRIALTGRTGARLEETAAQINGSPPEAEPIVFPADVSVPAQVHELVEHVVAQAGRIDALVNVAGFAGLRTIEQTDPDFWQRMIDVNLSSVVHLTREAWPHLVSEPGRIVVNISSMASRDPFPGFAAYAAAKAAVNMFTLVTAREGKRAGLRSVCIAPGAVETDMLRSMFDEKTLPSDQALSPDEVARLIVDCITGRRSFDSGQTIFIHK